jgi:hypothetical protein
MLKPIVVKRMNSMLYDPSDEEDDFENMQYKKSMSLLKASKKISNEESK